MKISDEEIRHLAKVSSFTLSDKELAEHKALLEASLQYLDQHLDQINTESIEPVYSVDGLETIWRKDEIIDYDVTGDDLLALCPDTKDHMIKVPKVL